MLTTHTNHSIHLQAYMYVHACECVQMCLQVICMNVIMYKIYICIHVQAHASVSFTTCLLRPSQQQQQPTLWRQSLSVPNL